jgi:hypothetical protein
MGERSDQCCINILYDLRNISIYDKTVFTHFPLSIIN